MCVDLNKVHSMVLTKNDIHIYIFLSVCKNCVFTRFRGGLLLCIHFNTICIFTIDDF